MHAILANWCSVLRPVKLTSDPRCGLREWPVLPLRGGTNYFVHAAFLALRAHAASLGGIRNGLKAGISGEVMQWQLRAESNISWIDLKVHHICRSFIKFPYIETKFLAPNSPPKNAPLT